MDDQDAAVAVLGEAECLARLASQELGRLVTHAAGVLDIFPVNYALDGADIVFRTAEGSKLFELTVNDAVVFEVDDHTDTEAWSVVVRGSAHRVDSAAAVAAADELGLRPWIPTLKYNYVRIVPSAVTGRAFHRAPEPERYGIADY